jgi:hypothetical protein
MRGGWAALVLLAAAACQGGSSEPRRYLLDMDGAPCAVQLGPMWPLVLGHTIDVAEVDAPRGAAWISHAVAFGDSGGDEVYTYEGFATATWSEGDAGVVARTAAIDEGALRDLVPALVEADGIEAEAAVLAGATPGAHVLYAGPAAGADLGLAYDDNHLLYVSGVPIGPAQASASYAGMDGEHTHDGWTYGDDVSYPRLVSDGRTTVHGDAEPVEVSAEEFRDRLADLATDPPMVSTGAVAGGALIDGCDPPPDDGRPSVPASEAVDGAEAVAVDGGWHLRVHLTAPGPEPGVVVDFGPQLVLLGTRDGDTATIDALLTKPEVDLFVDLLS